MGSKCASPETTFSGEWEHSLPGLMSQFLIEQVKKQDISEISRGRKWLN